MICVGWVLTPGDIEISFLWDSERFPVVVIRDEQYDWEDYIEAFGTAGLKYHQLAWEHRIQWTPSLPISWHKEQAGVAEGAGDLQYENENAREDFKIWSPK